MMSAPPLPSIVSLPVPPVRTLTPEEPVIETPVTSWEASTFWKPATVTTSPIVWSALVRSTVVAARNSSVLFPAPPSIENSVLR